MKRLLLALLALAAASAGADTLPKGTKFIEYLESSGTQWINTGFSPSNKNGLYDNVTGDFLAYYGSRTDFTAFIPPAGLLLLIK